MGRLTRPIAGGLLVFAFVLPVLWGCRTEPFRPEEKRPPIEAQPTGSCVLDDRGGVCTAGGCTLVVPPAILSGPTPIEISRIPVPRAVAPEVFGDVACRVGPDTLVLPGPARLTLEISPPPVGFEVEDAVAAFVDGAELTLAPDTQVQPGGRGGVALTVRGTSVVVLTFLSATIRAAGEISAGAGTIMSRADLLRVLASRSFVAAFHDGTRLYVGHGDRVLVYADGLPADPIRAPEVVVGAASLTAPTRSPGAADLGATVAGIWSDGRRLAVASGNRVLIWNQIPTEDHVPADLVLGQTSFAENRPNQGRSRPGADTLHAPNQILSDGRLLLVADALNHRFLLWQTFPSFVAQPADVVIGQADFDRQGVNEGALPVYQARGIHLDQGRLFLTSTFAANCVFALDRIPDRSNPAPDLCVGTRRNATRVGPLELSRPGALAGFGPNGLAARDFTGNRVNVWRTAPTASGDAPDFVLGQPSAEIGGSEVGIRASSLGDLVPSAGLYTDDARMLVPAGRRLLVFAPLPEHGYAPATQVIGQGTFSALEPGADYGALDGDSLAHPAGIDISPDGILAVADTANDRVLLLEGGRAIALGQPDLTSFGPNRFRPGPTADTLSGPVDVRFHRGRLYVTDAGNHRVLVWDPIPSASGTPADLILGQPGPGEGAPNRGRGDANGDGWSDAEGRGLFYPSGLAARGSRLWVSDRFNHRILVFALPLAGDDAPIAVLGQPDLRSNRPNRGAGFLEPTAGGLAAPTGLVVDARGALYVADTQNDRILRYPPGAGTGAVPDAVLGQDDLESVRAPTYTPSAPGWPLPEDRRVANASTVRQPRGLALESSHLFVADAGNHRILRHRLDAFGPDATADCVIGQLDAERRDANAFGPGPRSLARPTGLAVSGGRLWTSDRENHRILGFDLDDLAGPGPDADRVLGQPDYLENGFNRSLGDRGSVADPVGVVRLGGYTWVSDRARHRVIGFVDGEAKIVLGQPNLTRVLPNSGGEAGPSTLHGPTGLATDGQRLVVADTENHRVLVWSEIPLRSGEAADRVLGQEDLYSAEPNRGRGVTDPDAASLHLPTGVDLRRDRLVVADAGNNRVLVFDQLPSQSGAAADAVLCQPDFRSSLPNRGSAGAAPETCYGPADAVFLDPGLAVADTLNDRVLVFEAGSASGRAASIALGQPDLSSRGAPPPRADTLSGPFGLATDGVNLLVADQGNNRILSFYRPDLRTGLPARQVIGQPSFESREPQNGPVDASRPSGLLLERLSFIESRLIYADTGNARVVEVTGVRR